MMHVIRRKDTGMYFNGHKYWDVKWVPLQEARTYTSRAAAGRSKGALISKTYEYRIDGPFELEFVAVELKVMGVVK